MLAARLEWHRRGREKVEDEKRRDAEALCTQASVEHSIR